MTGAERIAQERKRQIVKERWSAKHDDQHYDGSLLKAAVAYLDVNHTMAAKGESFCLREQYEGQTIFSAPWPDTWDDSYDKRGKHSCLRRLGIAGALIAAEIDRLIRAGEKES